MTRPACIGLAFAMLLAAIGCGPANECELGQTRCGSAGVQSCERDCSGSGCGYYRWSSTRTCTGLQSCVQPAGLAAFCAESTGNDPGCGAGASSSYCERNDLVTCADGYRVRSAPCGSATQCMPDAQQGGAACVMPGAVANPTCADANGDESGRHCEGSTVVRCVGGYEVARMICQACSVSLRKCTGYLGDTCSTDAYCANGLSCRQGRCTVACEVQASPAADPGDAGDAGDEASGDPADAGPAAPEVGGGCKAVFSGSAPYRPEMLDMGFGNYVLKCVAGLCAWE